jgi:hypothetical protein
MAPRNPAVEAEAGEAVEAFNNETEQNDFPELVPQDDEESLAEEEADNESEDKEEEQNPPRQSERIRSGVREPSRYAAATVKL